MSYDPPTRLLHVDLSEERVRSRSIPADWRRQFVGGKGLAARILYDELDAGTDPLGPANALLFVLGPLSGVLPGEPRYAVVTRSPLSGTFLDSYGGGSFPTALCGALGDHLGVLVTGRADRPVRLTVAEGTARIEPADDLWGLDTVETDTAIDDALACIGPAGERCVRYATIASDGGRHQAGRGGAGAVMGSKRLKAVVARGEPPELPTALSAARERFVESFTADETSAWYLTSETLESVDFANEVGALATRGWRARRFEGTDGVGIEAARRATRARERGDDPIPGGFRVETDEGESVPRGATSMTFGAGLGIDEFDAVAALGGACDRLGLDVIDAGSAVAWTVRASDAGFVDRDLDFGDPDGARALLREIAGRETPLGDALAEGIDRAAAGYDTPAFVPTVKGMSLPGYDPRGAPSMALAYATSDRGACHRRSLPIEDEPFAGEAWSPVDVARLVAHDQTLGALFWCLIADDFLTPALTETLGVDWLSAVGLRYAPEELLAVGERTWTLTRLFNVREGFSRRDDAVSVLFDDPDSGLDRDAFEATLDAYYATLGWDAAGVPTDETLDRLGLGDLVDPATRERLTGSLDASEPES